MFLIELMVEDLSCIPSRDRVGEDRAEALESHRTRGELGMGNAAEDFTGPLCDDKGRNDAEALPCSAVEGIRKEPTAADSELTDVLVMLAFVELVGITSDAPDSEAITLGGRGNNGPFFRLGRRKKVVVVCIVCVVVVVVA